MIYFDDIEVGDVIQNIDSLYYVYKTSHKEIKVLEIIRNKWLVTDEFITYQWENIESVVKYGEFDDFMKLLQNAKVYQIDDRREIVASILGMKHGI